MVGKLAVSLAGHDKGSIFLVIREDGDVIWLADGISRLYQSPKRKKRKHVQLVLNGGMDSSELEDLFQNSADVLNFLFLFRFPFVSIFIQNSADTESDFDIIFLVQVGK